MLRGYTVVLGLALATLSVPSPGAEPKADPERLVFSGTVVDADGKSVEGATVEVYSSEANSISYEVKEPNEKVVTKADGKFELHAPSGSVLLLASKSGLAPFWRQFWQASSDETGLKLVLGKPLIISGTVVDAAGKGVGGAEVFVTVSYLEIEIEPGVRSMGFLPEGSAFGRRLFSTRSETSGAFTLTGVPPGMNADLEVVKPGMCLHPMERDHVSPQNMRCRSGQTNIVLTLEEAGTISGAVTTEAGQPLPGVSVHAQIANTGTFYSAPPKTESHADGSFVLANIRPGDYQIRTVFGTNDVPDWTAQSITVTVEAGNTNTDAKIVAAKGGLVEISVVDAETKKPVAKASANLGSHNYQVSRGTGPEGKMVFRVPVGEYQVVAYKDGVSSDSQTVAAVAGETVRVQLLLKGPSKISGRVTYPDGKPATKVELKIVPEWLASQKLAIDAEGKFEMNWNASRASGPDRTPSIVARDPERNLAVAAEIPEDTRTIDLQLKPALTLVGKVENTKGEPIPDAVLNLYYWSGNMGSSLDRKPAKTDAQGRFEIKALPQGSKYSVNASAKGYGSASGNLNPEDSETTRHEFPAFVLAVADKKLGGKVVDADDKPVARASVHIYGSGQPSVSVTTDDQGAFVIEEVCDGTIQISAYLSGGRSSHGNARAEGGDTNVVIRLGDSNVSYSEAAPRRTSLKGKPLPELTDLGFTAEQLPAEKPLLVCLFDAEQRPSRKLLRLLDEQRPNLGQKDVQVVGIHVNPDALESFNDWKSANPMGFTVGRVGTKDNPKLKWTSTFDTLPWLILTDAKHKVVAEGFALEEIEAKLKGL